MGYDALSAALCYKHALKKKKCNMLLVNAKCQFLSTCVSVICALTLAELYLARGLYLIFFYL